MAEACQKTGWQVDAADVMSARNRSGGDTSNEWRAKCAKTTRPDPARAFRYFGYGEELSAMFGRKVDFSSRLDKHIEAVVRHEAVPIYEHS